MCSQALCRLKARPDQEGCPGPCLGDRVRWTQSGGGGGGVCGGVSAAVQLYWLRLTSSVTPDVAV